MLTDEEIKELKSILFKLAENENLPTAMSAAQVLARMAEVEKVQK